MHQADEVNRVTFDLVADVIGKRAAVLAGESVRADMIAALVEKGYGDRITLSHDSCCNFHWAPEGMLEERAPTWRLTYIPLDVLPMLRERGVSDAAIHQMTVLNPRKVFGG